MAWIEDDSSLREAFVKHMTWPETLSEQAFRARTENYIKLLRTYNITGDIQCPKDPTIVYRRCQGAWEGTIEELQLKPSTARQVVLLAYDS